MTASLLRSCHFTDIGLEIVNRKSIKADRNLGISAKTTVLHSIRMQDSTFSKTDIIPFTWFL